MIYLFTVIASFLNTSTVILLAILTLIMFALKRNLDAAYINSVIEQRIYTKGISRMWKIVNITIAVAVTVVGSSQLVDKYYQVKKEAEVKPIVQVVQSAKRFDKTVFYFCVNTSKGKNEGIPADVINACKDAATYEAM